MPLFRLDNFCDGQIKVAVWHTTESEETLRQLIPPTLMAQYEQRLAQLKAPKRRLEWLASRVAAHHVLGILHPISYYPTGRPHRPQDDISIAHTASYAAVALSQCGRVGIDIEQYGPKVMRVLRFFVQDGEQPAGPMTQDYALFLWTVKEAVYKLYDAGLSMRDDILVPPIRLSLTGEAQAFVGKLNRQCRVQYALCTPYVASLVYE